MPCYVVKPARDRDEYVWWSTITESPLAIGTRDEVRAVMAQYGKPAEADPARFDRADQTGTSALWPDPPADSYLGWNDKDLIAEQRGLLPRALLAEYCRLYLADDEAAFDLLEPFEDGENK